MRAAQRVHGNELGQKGSGTSWKHHAVWRPNPGQDRGLLRRVCQPKPINPGTRKAYEATSKDRTKGNRLAAKLGQKFPIFLSVGLYKER